LEEEDITRGTDYMNVLYIRLSFIHLSLKVRFHHHIIPTNLKTNLLTKSPYKQMSHIFVLFVSQKFVANQIGLLQTHHGNFASEFVIKFAAKMWWWKRTFTDQKALGAVYTCDFPYESP
jgi:hypothetical protein